MMNKVLFIDDEQFILQTVQRKLEKTEIDVYVAQDGYTGISLMESEDISVVFTDLIMPKINGLHLAEAIHKINPKAVIVVLSGNASADIITKTMNTHIIYKYLIKPWKIDGEAIEFIRECLAEAERRDQEPKFSDGGKLFVEAAALNAVEDTTWVLTDQDNQVLMSSRYYSNSMQFKNQEIYRTVNSSKGPLRLYVIN